MSAIAETAPTYKTDLRLGDQHTNKLVQDHRDLDEAIKKGSRFSLGFGLTVKKIRRTHTKDELMRRIRAGDGEAIAYGTRREWIGPVG